MTRDAPRQAEEAEMEDAHGSKGLRREIMPTAKEVEEHERTHIPFRSWCKHCIMGRAMNSPHFQIKDRAENELTTVSLDYGYMKKKIEGEDEKNLGNPICL